MIHRFASDPDEQVIVDRIYTAVMEQRLAPKTKLSESQLCDSFGVGRMRVRRALLLLASQGIIDLQANRGAFVACPDAKEANDVFEARKLIEPGLIGVVTSVISKSDLADLRKHIAMEDAARSNPERAEIIRLSGEFHVKLASVSRNAVLIRMIGELVTRTSLIVGLFGDSGKSTCPDGEHAKILGAIEAGDAALAENLVCKHLMHIQDGLDLTATKPDLPDLKKILSQ
ncbi:GntR family transcriptional regulator [Anderseniella sp. Alg231-50]|uniref:GntR family transcriptional regulator n=1 Tax=Anderseniella sp. Alg231-50 TaxID=1922226 RepID=UPI00307BC421